MQTFGKCFSKQENSQGSADRQKGWLRMDQAGEIHSYSAWRQRVGACWGFSHVKPEALGRIS